MKTLRKIISLLLCLCVSTYALPVFAVTAVKGEAIKVELSDAALEQAVGGGNVDATMSEYTGGVATAVLANRSTMETNYTLSVINANGAVTETLASGVLLQDQAIIVSGTPANASNSWIQARIWNGTFTGLEAKDTSVLP
jgi:hypothetical protein